MVEVHYFAAAADIAGRQDEVLPLSPTATLVDLRMLLSGRYGQDMDRLLDIATFLIGDELTREGTSALGERVDILPPFAGG